MSDTTQYYTIRDTTIGLTRPRERQVWEQSYWKYQWCSGIVLAHHLATLSGSGQTLLELGPGLGLSAIIAKKAGFHVTVVDKMSGALEYTKKNFVNNTVEEPIYANQTWEQFLHQNRSLFNVIIGSDVLYEPAQIPIILNLFNTSLILGGVIYMASPVRVPNVVYDKFIDQLNASKFEYTEQMITSPIPPEAPPEYDGDEIRLLTISRIK